MAFDPDKFLSNDSNGLSSSAFNPVEFLGIPASTAQRELAMGLLAGTGQTMSPEAALNKSRQRFVARSHLEGQPNIQLLNGKVVDVNQLSPLASALLSVPRSFSSGQNLGITDVAEKGIENALLSSGLVSQDVVNALGVGAQRRQQSPSDVISNALGNVATGAGAGSAVGQSPGLLRKLISGASTGAQAGGLSELNTQISEGQPLNSGKIGESSLIGAGVGLGVPAVAQGLVTSGKLTKNVAGSLSRVSPVEGLDAKFSDYMLDVLRPSTKAAKSYFDSSLKSGQLQDNLRNIGDIGTPNGIEQALTNGRQAADNLSSRIDSHILENQDVVINNDDVANSIRNITSGKKLVSKAAKNEISDLADKVSGDLTYREAFDLQNELNARRQAYFKKDAAGQATDLDDAVNEAEQLARDMLGDKLNKTYQSLTGNTDNPYTQYGSLTGFLDSISTRVDDLLTKRGIEKSVGPTLDKEVLSTIQKNKSLLTGGELGRVNDRIRKAFALLKESQPTRIRNLTTEEISNLPPVQREFPNSPQANQLELERIIKDLTQRAQAQRLSDILKQQGLSRSPFPIMD